VIVKVNTRKRDGGATRLDKAQWENGEAALLDVQNFPTEKIAMDSMAYRAGVLESYASKNIHISNKARKELKITHQLVKAGR